MTGNDQSQAAGSTLVAPAWGAVVAMAVCVSALLTAEFLPASLLTPMAASLGVSEGMAGQSVTATAIVAMFASLLVTTVTRGVDRRSVVLAFAVLLTISSLLVALAPGFTTMLVGRILLGAALGGFWAMAASLAMRLVPAKDVARALSIVFAGVSVAMVIAAPVGSFLGGIIGWRGVFLAAAGLGLCCLAWLAATLPPLPARGRANIAGIFVIARRPGVRAAMLAIFSVFAGQFAYFTYVRPFLEGISGFDVNGLSVVLLVFGVANFAGTSLAAPMLNRDLKLALALPPLALAICAAGLVLFGDAPLLAASLIAVWGLVFGAIPVGWSTWITRNLADDAENAGGLQVAVIQLANTCGAALGGYVLDTSGANGPIVVGGLLLLAASCIVAMNVGSSRECASTSLQSARMSES